MFRHERGALVRYALECSIGYLNRLERALPEYTPAPMCPISAIWGKNPLFLAQKPGVFGGLCLPIGYRVYFVSYSLCVGYENRGAEKVGLTGEGGWGVCFEKAKMGRIWEGPELRGEVVGSRE